MSEEIEGATLDPSFAVIAEDIEEDPAGDDPGTVHVIAQTLYQGKPDSWGRGDRVGEAHGAFVVVPSGRAQVSVTLVLESVQFVAGEHTIVASGSLPFGDQLESGAISIVGGTGRYKGLRGVLRFDVVNPKRWTVEG